MITFTAQHAAEISGIVNWLDWLRYEDISPQSVKFWCGPEVTVCEFWD